MIRFVGLDVHKKLVVAAVLDAQGGLVAEHKIPATAESLTAFAREQLTPEDRVALEATTNCWAVVAQLEPHVAEVVVSNPLRTKAIASAKIKTDKIDARVLAQLLRLDYLPRVWQPDPTTRARRQATHRRASLVGLRTGSKNRIHAILHQRLIPVAVPELFNARGRAWLAALELDDAGRAALESELRILALAETEIAALDRRLAEGAYQEPRLRLLMTLPGVDFGIATTLLAALGDITRFDSPDQAAAYLGLAPSTRQSGAHCYHGSITRHGNPHARWLLVQAAQHLAAHPGPLGVFFRRLMKKKNRNVAVVACARKLVVIAWHMLRRNEPYRYAQPRQLAAKMSRLRVRVTGARRRGGLAQGSGRSPRYGLGRTRRVPALSQVCAAEALPAPQPLAPGEQRMVADHGLAAFHRQIQTSYREPKKKTAAQ